MFDQEVLSGKAIQVWDLPVELHSESALEDLFRRHFSGSPAASVQQVWINPRRPTNNSKSSSAKNSTEGRHKILGGSRHRQQNGELLPTVGKNEGQEEEVAALCFATAEAVRHVIDRLQTVATDHAEDLGLVLHRGYLTLDEHRLLVEAVLLSQGGVPDSKGGVGDSLEQRAARNGDGSTKAVPSTRLSEAKTTRTQEDEEDPTATVSPQGVGATLQSAETSVSGAKESDDSIRAMQADAAQFMQLFEGKPRVIVLVKMFLLYARPRGNASGRVKEFTVTPYIVFQMVRGLCRPLRVHVPSQPSRDSGRRSEHVTTALVELSDMTEATQTVRALSSTVVEFMSPYTELPAGSAATQGKSTDTGSRVNVEGRFQVFAQIAHVVSPGTKPIPTDMPEAIPMVNSKLTMCISPGSTCMVSPAFNRVWLDDFHEGVPSRPITQTASQPQMLSVTSVGSTWIGGGLPFVPQVGLVASSRAAAVPNAAAMAHQPRPRSRSSSRERHHQRTERESDRNAKHHRNTVSVDPGSAAVPPDPALMSFGTPVVQPMMMPMKAMPMPSQMIPQSQEMVPFPQVMALQAQQQNPTAAGYRAYMIAHGAQPPLMAMHKMAVYQPIGQPQAGPSDPASGRPAMASTDSSPPPPPPLMYDQYGPLPAGWRAIFSAQYQQIYYVHRDTTTGVESTTWTRPGMPQRLPA